MTGLRLDNVIVHSPRMIYIKVQSVKEDVLQLNGRKGLYSKWCCDSL